MANEKTVEVLAYGTIVLIRDDLEATITAVQIGEHDICYKCEWFDGPTLVSEWLDRCMFVVKSCAYKTRRIGFIRDTEKD